MSRWDNISDSELLLRLKQDEHSAFAAIYHRYKGLLFVHAFKVLDDEEEASDIVQEVFSMLWARRAELNIISNLRGYLYTTIRNKSLDIISHKAVKDKYLDSLTAFLEKGECVTDHCVLEKELAEIIEKEIAVLPYKMREVFELSRLEEFTYKEIGQKLNISDKTVKKQVYNAIQILKQKLENSFLFIFF